MTTKVLDFLNQNNIKWFPCSINNKKEPAFTKDYMPNPKDFTTNRISENEFKRRQAFIDEFDYVVIDTSCVSHIDFDMKIPYLYDEKQWEFLEGVKKGMPYYKSISKGLPHAFFISTKPLTKRTQTIYKDIEILANSFSYCKKDAKIYNADKEILEMDITKLIQNEKQPTLIKKEEFNLDSIEPYLNKMGFHNIKWKNDYDFDCDERRKGKKCPLCKNEHRSNHFFIFKSKNKMFVKNHSNKCIKHEIKMNLEEDEDEEEDENDEEVQYTRIKKEFETQVCMINDCLMYPVNEKSGKQNFYNLHQLKERFNHLQIKSVNMMGKVNELPFVNKWSKDAEKRVYDTMDFIPENCPENIFNLWTGYDVEKITTNETGSIDMFLKVVNSLTKDESDYFLKWIARLFQKPNDKPLTSPVIQSEEQGTGKNSLFELLKLIMGEQYFFMTEDPQKDLFSQFSTAFDKRKLVIIDECDGNSTMTNHNKLKAKITSNTINVERKGLQSVVQKNLAGVVFLTNNKVPVKVEKHDRRFFAYDSSNRLKNDKEFWDEWYNTYITNKNNQKTIYDYLMNIDISNTDWIKERPDNDAYRQMQQECLPLEIKWIENLIIHEFTFMKTTNIPNYELFDSFKLVYTYETTLIKFGKLMERLIKKDEMKGFTKIPSKKGIKWNINRDEVFEWLKLKRYTNETELATPMQSRFYDENPDL